LDTPNRESKDDYRRRLFSETENLTPEEAARRQDLIGWIVKLVPKIPDETHDQWVDRVIEFLNNLEN
jgi:hypothetical protein